MKEQVLGTVRLKEGNILKLPKKLKLKPNQKFEIVKVDGKVVIREENEKSKVDLKSVIDFSKDPVGLFELKKPFKYEEKFGKKGYEYLDGKKGF